MTVTQMLVIAGAFIVAGIAIAGVDEYVELARDTGVAAS